ncbi:hypothetical protein O181_033755 [Austropuccinia psidii MF-1]|uniref:CCHC-type domain-containing protein n=1 Tax=Austropuccinia psidii MF-1 TaxID=1389203 RepID=A0A9Q3D1T7_9BASI|nr:hypothetical protein [Austropuccinia psidii MF-1]
MLDDIANNLKDVRKRTDTGKYSLYQGRSFRDKQPFTVGNKDKLREKVAEFTKKKNSCHNCGSTGHYSNNFSQEKKKLHAIEQVPEDFKFDSMGDAIRENSDDDQDPIGELLAEYQEETQLEIQDIQLESGLPQDTANKNLCKHTQDAQKFLVTPTKGME